LNNHVIWLNKLSIGDIDKVGGKNASLGELLTQLSSKSISIPDGFAITVDAFEHFLISSNIKQPINELLDGLNIENAEELQRTSTKISALISDASLPSELITC
jgi:pyruvate,water dikinase